MDLIYTNAAREDQGVLHDYEFDLAFGADENNFECTVQIESHCMEAGSFLYIEGTEYGGIVDSVEVNTEQKTVTYSGRTWHGILESSVIQPPKIDTEVEKEITSSLLPKGYKQIHAIESTGTQFVDTGFKPNQDTRVVCEFDYTTAGYVFGSENAYRNNSFDFYTRLAVFNATSQTFTALSTSEKHIVDFNKNVVVVDGSTKTTFTYAAFSSGLPLFLFAVNNGGNGIEGVVGKIYSCQIYDNGTLVRDYVPCIDPDGNVGLYDLVNGTFYGNAGTGSFIAHEIEIRELPEGYTQAEYIESSGTQYIDTGFRPTFQSRIVVDIEGLTANTQMVFGVRNAASSTASQMFNVFRRDSLLRSDYFGTNVSTTISDTTARTTIDKNSNATTMYGVTLTNTTVTSGVCDNSLYLFNANQSGSPISDCYASFKLYACQIYDNDVLVRDFVPCANASGEFGLYDMVTQQFFGNAGSGAFTGAKLPKYVELPEGYTQVEYIQSSGTQYIDTGVVVNSSTYNRYRFLLDTEYTTVSSSYYLIHGCSAPGAIYYCGLSNTGQIVYGNGTLDMGTSVTVAAGRYSIDFDPHNGKYVFGGVLTLTGITFNAPSSSRNIFLFAYNNGTGAIPHVERLYSFKIYDNDVPIRDYVPCINPDGNVGLYDQVNGVFYGNPGTGVFYAGSRVFPPSSSETILVKVSTKYDYYEASGEANEVLGELIEYLGLGDVFTASSEDSEIDIARYSFRYVNAYTGIRKMLAEFEGKLKLAFNRDIVVLSVEQLFDYSLDEEWEDSQVDFVVKRNYKPVNHLICLGSGNLKDRHVIHLFTDENGGIQPYKTVDNPKANEDYILDTSSQLLFGIDEVAEVYDYSSAQTTENYVVLEEQPGDWVTNYANYFTQDDSGTYSAVVGVQEVQSNVLTSKPADWAEKFGSYFIKDGDSFKTVESVTVDNYVPLTVMPNDWATNYGQYYKYYSDGLTADYRHVGGESHTQYVPQTMMPSDWSSTYTSYYKKVVTERKLVNEKVSRKITYERIDSKSAPEWRRNTFYTQVSYTEAPKWQYGYYYTLVPTTSAPEWEADKYYTVANVIVNPGFAKNKYYEKKLDHFAEMVAGGLERLKASHNCDAISIDLDLEGTYDIGDIVGASEHVTGIAVWQPITKKIVSIKNGKITISYKVGD